MTTINYVKGNIIDIAKTGNYDCIAHCCNCFNTMGSGVAFSLKIAFPEIYEADKKTSRGDLNKLGNFTSTTIRINNNLTTIYNLYGQYRYGRDKKYLNEYALGLAMYKMELYLESYSRILLPKLGCANAGGSWEDVSKIIVDILCSNNHIVTVCEL